MLSTEEKMNLTSRLGVSTLRQAAETASLISSQVVPSRGHIGELTFLVDLREFNLSFISLNKFSQRVTSEAAYTVMTELEYTVTGLSTSYLRSIRVAQGLPTF